MDLIFSSNPANYRSFLFDFKRETKEYETFFGVRLSSIQSEYKRNANVIMEHMAKMGEPKSIFKIDGGLSVDFNNEGKVLLDCIITDFIGKLKYKKYKTLGLWIPLLQDHFWNNVKKTRPTFKKKKVARKPSHVESAGIKAAIKYTPTWAKIAPVPDFEEDNELVGMDISGNEIRVPANNSQSVPPPITQEQIMNSLSSGRSLSQIIQEHEVINRQIAEQLRIQQKIQRARQHYTIYDSGLIASSASSDPTSTSYITVNSGSLNQSSNDSTNFF